MINLFENEIPKHRKKRSKTVKKSDHKHDYVLTEIDESSLRVKTIDGRFLVRMTYTCSICEKEDYDSKFITREKYEEMKKQLSESE
jgi:hypothetical protein